MNTDTAMQSVTAPNAPLANAAAEPFDVEDFRIERFLKGFEADVSSMIWSICRAVGGKNPLEGSPFSFGHSNLDDPNHRWVWSFIEVTRGGEATALMGVSAREQQGQRLYCFSSHQFLLDDVSLDDAEEIIPMLITNIELQLEAVPAE